jgi:hypothetical protein
MATFPHHFTVSLTGKPEREVNISCDGFESIASTAPLEFDGQGSR